MAELINSNSIRSFSDKSSSNKSSNDLNKPMVTTSSSSSSSSSNRTIGSGFSLPSPSSSIRSSPIKFLNQLDQPQTSPTTSTTSLSPIPSTSSIRGYNNNSSSNTNINNSSQEKKYKDILPNPMNKQQTPQLQPPPMLNRYSSHPQLLQPHQKSTGNNQSLDCLTSLLYDLNDKPQLIRTSPTPQLQDSYICKHCEKSFPTTMFKNRDSFNFLHSNNCTGSAIIKKRKGDESYVPELNSLSSIGGSEKFRKLNKQQDDNESSSHIEIKDEFLPFNKSLIPPTTTTTTTTTTSTRDTMSINSLNNEPDTQRIPSSSPYSPQQHGEDQFSSPRSDEKDPSSTPNPTSSGLLRFALLDVIEDKIQEETELEYIRRDFKNIGNEIIIQDMKKEKDIQQLYHQLNTELKETEDRVKFDIVDRQKHEENQMKQIKNELISQYNELEGQLKMLIEKLNNIPSSSSSKLSTPSTPVDQIKSYHSSPTNSNKDDENLSDKELTIDDGDNEKVVENKLKSETTTPSPTNLTTVITTNDDKETTTATTNKDNSNNTDTMKLKITFSKKSPNIIETLTSSTPIKQEQQEDEVSIRKEIVKKIEEIKKTMSDRIINYSVALATQGREFDRLITIESNEYEKHLAKKFNDLKRDLNENTDALATSFDILDNILINQTQHHLQIKQFKQQQHNQSQQQQQNQPPLPQIYGQYNNSNSNSQISQQYPNQQQSNFNQQYPNQQQQQQQYYNQQNNNNYNQQSNTSAPSSSSKKQNYLIK